MSAADYKEGFICNLQTCRVEDWGYVHYQPSIPGNALFAALLGLLAIAQVWLWRKYKTGGMAVAMMLGLLTEVLGYVARILLHNNPFYRDYFLWYLITLTIGPVFIAAAIYLTLGRIVVAYGEGISRLKPKTYTTVFLACDIVSLVVQAAGGGIAASYPVTNQYMIDIGTNILVAGLSIQVASLFAFSACSIEFLLRAKKRRDQRNPEFAGLVASKRFKIFLVALFLATALLFIRTVFRAVELSEGFAGELANNEVQFMVLDGVMVILACTCLTVFHPGWGFQGHWQEANFKFRKNKNKSDAEIAEGVTTDGTPENGSEKRVAHVSENRAIHL